MGLTEADREMLRAATQRAKSRYWAARHGASCGVMVFSEGDAMSVEMREGVWKSRGDQTVKVRRHDDLGLWVGDDGYHRDDDGRFTKGAESELDLVEWLDVPDKPVQPPQSQPDAAEELAALNNDRDRWQTRAVQAEGRVKTLGQELATARQQLQDRDAADQVPGNEQLRQQVTQLIAEREGLSQLTRCDAVTIEQLNKDLQELRREMRHAEQQRSILLETSQDQLGQIRMAERIVSLMADKVAQLAVEGA